MIVKFCWHAYWIGSSAPVAGMPALMLSSLPP
jgi:hypothetical protein